MANSFNPLFAEPSANGGPRWMSALASDDGFQPDIRFTERRSANRRAPEPKPDPVAEAFLRGVAQGKAEAAAEQDLEEAHRAHLRLALTRFDTEQAEDFRMLLAEAVVQLCEATIAPAAIDPDALTARCDKVVALMRDKATQSRLYLHPDDIALLDPEFAQERDVTADPSLERGTIRAEGPDGGFSDGPGDWRRQLAEALGTC